jgi:hypothetical protein
VPSSTMAGRGTEHKARVAGSLVGRSHSRRSLQPEKVDGGDVLRRDYCSALYATQEPLLTAF